MGQDPGSTGLGQGEMDANSSQPGGSYLPGGPKSDGTKPYSEKVDLNDLDWEDRERVLRLLFSKMNAGMPVNANRLLLKQMVG